MIHGASVATQKKRGPSHVRRISNENRNGIVSHLKTNCNMSDTTIVRVATPCTYATFANSEGTNPNLAASQERFTTCAFAFPLNTTAQRHKRKRRSKNTMSQKKYSDSARHRMLDASIARLTHKN